MSPSLVRCATRSASRIQPRPSSAGKRASLSLTAASTAPKSICASAPCWSKQSSPKSASRPARLPSSRPIATSIPSSIATVSRASRSPRRAGCAPANFLKMLRRNLKASSPILPSSHAVDTIFRPPGEPGYAAYQLIRSVLAAYATDCKLLRHPRRASSRSARRMVRSHGRGQKCRFKCAPQGSDLAGVGRTSA